MHKWESLAQITVFQIALDLYSSKNIKELSVCSLITTD